MTEREQIIECIEEIEQGSRAVETYRDIWQNNLIWWLCKAVRLLLLGRLKNK